MDKLNLPSPEFAAAAGIDIAELRDLSVHARERVGRVLKDVIVLSNNPSTMSGIGISGVAGVYDVMAGLVHVMLTDVHKKTVTEKDSRRIAAALMIVQLQAARDGDLPRALREFKQFLVITLRRPDLAEVIKLDGF